MNKITINLIMQANLSVQQVVNKDSFVDYSLFMGPVGGRRAANKYQATWLAHSVRKCSRTQSVQPKWHT